MGANVLKLLDHFVGALLGQHGGRHVGLVLEKGAVVGSSQLQLDI